MAVDERARHQLHSKLEYVLGAEEAATMMELTPPVGWGDVVTKSDLQREIAATKRDLQHEIAELGSALRRDMAEHQAQTQKEFAAVYNGMAEGQRSLTRLTWSMTIALLANALAIVGLAIQVAGA